MVRRCALFKIGVVCDITGGELFQKNLLLAMVWRAGALSGSGGWTEPCVPDKQGWDVDEAPIYVLLASRF